MIRQVWFPRIFLIIGICLVSCAGRPGWIDTPPQTGADEFFVGISRRMATEKDARNAALVDATEQFVRFCGLDVRLVERYLNIGSKKISPLTRKISAEQKLQLAEAFVSRIKPLEWYIDAGVDLTASEPRWKAYVLIKVPQDEIEKVRQSAQKQRKEQLKPVITELKHIGKGLEQVKELLAGSQALTGSKALKELKQDLSKLKEKTLLAGDLEKTDENGTATSPSRRLVDFSGISPDERFVASEDGLVKDRILGLIWQIRGAESKMDWESARRYCRGLQIEGKNDWRLPTKEELASLIYRKGLDDCPYIYPVFQVNCGWYWTGDKRNGQSAWNVSFGSGQVYWSHPDYDNVSVLAVRAISSAE
ncbi:MAG: DUF1566 domain-containing protein [bacterium]